jgi:hypothetical protein
MTAEVYLGDGLYASFDGYQVRLRAPDTAGDRVVFLEPEVLDKFEMYLAELRAKIEQFKSENQRVHD